MNNGRTYLQTDFKVFCDNEQSSSELGSNPDKIAPWPFGYVPGGQSFFTDTPPRIRPTLSASLGENCTRALPLILRVLPFLVIPPMRDPCPHGKLNQFFELTGGEARVAISNAAYRRRFILSPKISRVNGNSKTHPCEFRELVQSKRTGSIPVEGFKVAVKEWATGSGCNLNSKCGTHRKPDTRTDESSFNHTSIPDNRRSVAASRSPFSNRPKARPGQSELGLQYHKVLCERCGVNEQYWSATWCSDCIWMFVRQ